MAAVSSDKALGPSCVALSLIVGFVQAWVNRFYVAVDGISYLDMADAYLRHDWQSAINNYWNPLYSWIIGLGFLLFHPNSYWEYPVVHLVNFLIYVCTVIAFEYFLRGLLKDRDDAAAIRIIAYALFLWTSLEMIRVWMVNPDMLVAACVYFASGVLIRPIQRWSPLLLGVTLAAGYYAKSVMIPIGCLVLVASYKILTRRQWILAASIFGILCLPLVFVLSRAAGHFTISETGPLNYSWQANDIQRWYWRGGPAQAGYPIHPARIALDTPRVYQFSGVFPTTYPIWYDASYWFRGLHVWWNPRGFAHNLLRNGKGVTILALAQGGGFLAGLVLCFYRTRGQIRTVRLAWPIWAVSLGSILLYCAVHCEPRYLGSFFAIAFLLPFAALNIPQKRLAVSVAVLGLVWAGLFFRVTTVRGEQLRPWAATPVNTYWQVTSSLEAMGLMPGQNVGLVSSGAGLQNSRWARLAKVHIVAEMFGDFDYWKLNGTDQQRVLAALAASGAKMAVTNEPPPDGADAPGWTRLGPTSYYALPLQPLFSNGENAPPSPTVSSNK